MAASPGSSQSRPESQLKGQRAYALALQNYLPVGCSAFVLSQWKATVFVQLSHCVLGSERWSLPPDAALMFGGSGWHHPETASLSKHPSMRHWALHVQPEGPWNHCGVTCDWSFQGRCLSGTGLIPSIIAAEAPIILQSMPRMLDLSPSCLKEDSTFGVVVSSSSCRKNSFKQKVEAQIHFCCRAVHPRCF